MISGVKIIIKKRKTTVKERKIRYYDNWLFKRPKKPIFAHKLNMKYASSGFYRQTVPFFEKVAQPD